MVMPRWVHVSPGRWRRSSRLPTSWVSRTITSANSLLARTRQTWPGRPSGLCCAAALWPSLCCAGGWPVDIDAAPIGGRCCIGACAMEGRAKCSMGVPVACAGLCVGGGADFFGKPSSKDTLWRESAPFPAIALGPAAEACTGAGVPNPPAIGAAPKPSMPPAPMPGKPMPLPMAMFPMGGTGGPPQGPPGNMPPSHCAA
mmetsp:Transcript_35129/g.101525  ORF Transcript_35129/g.101525 Transcript_35129/m.101525 type:complete len:200 (+) Transcript_35129:980-1579(+)